MEGDFRESHLADIPGAAHLITRGKLEIMKNMKENENNYDVIIDDGGRIYKMEFLAGPMTEPEIIADFMDGYDGDIEAAEIDITFPAA